jgi:hypothetical protein
MPRPKHIDRPQRIEVNLPQSILSKVHTELYSDVEGRVPYGAASALFTELATKWLESRGVQV